MIQKKQFINFLFIFFACNANGQAQKEINLTENSWEFRQIGKDDWLKANVPSSVHMDLLRNELIEDPFHDNNEIKQRWIEAADWEYQTTFNVNQALLEFQKLEIHFEGLDTYGQIFLNGKALGKTFNMFREWSFDIKPFVIQGENELRIEFESPLNHNRNKVKNYGVDLPSGNETVDLRVSPFTRKAIYQFGWDWGPRFVSCGIWKPIKIKAWNEVRILEASCETLLLNDTLAIMELDVEIESREAKGHYELRYRGERVPIKLKAGKNRYQFNFDVINPKLWWPNGWGKANLHNMDIDIMANLTSEASFSFQYGIRDIRFINQGDDIGTSFLFEVNGQEIFVKGSNYVPQEIFLENIDEDDYEKIILKAKNAHMNMLRVWGGGIYEKDIFYDLCDRHGIMVWQDFMFANSLYPTDFEFLKNISEEIIQNIKRLKKHPSIVFWCGNNEINVAWNNWGWQSQYKYSKTDSIALWNGQLQIFQVLIPDLLSEYYPTANYASTTPLSNWGKAENFNFSSMHYWGVWHGKEPFSSFKNNVGRFMVEYGFQSFPDHKLLKKSMSDSSLYLESQVMQNRQKSYIGNGLIKKHAEKWFGPAENFEDFVDKSQQTQAIALQIAIMQHRLQSPHCMGTLFWQFNDCWPGPSWSVINYDGTDKKAYSIIQTWYDDVVAIPHIQNGKLSIVLNSNRRMEFSGTLILKIQDFEKEYRISKLKPNTPLRLNIDRVIKENTKIELKLKEEGKTIWKTKVPSILVI